MKGILFLVAENGALPNGKVGGVGDVVRELPLAFAERGLETAVLTPAYGMLASLPGARPLATVKVRFGGVMDSVGLYEVPTDNGDVSHYVLDHPRFEPNGPGLIYCDDAADAPFATDASKFAFFTAAAAAVLRERALPGPRIIHLHDWPSALFLVLREFDPAYASLKKVRTVFTIHNLALQGIRPLDGNRSSLLVWFPWLEFDAKTVADPRWPDCVNPMAAAIRLADKINTVSPTYAKEILKSNAPERGFNGGEGLEADLKNAHAHGRLVSILNGCAYSLAKSRRPGWVRLLNVMRMETIRWIARERQVRSAHFLAQKQLEQLSSRRPSALLTSVGRLAAQKTQLFREQTAGGVSALEAILAKLDDRALFIMLGSGDPDYESFLTETAATRANFLFLRGYSDELAQLLYRVGDLFLMPSSFEPCGISQMLAMRAGQLCVVHGVGGLKDTVSDGTTGFVFDGKTPRTQARNFVNKVTDALDLRRSSCARWRRMQQAAAAQRFTWEASAAAYEQKLYAIKNI